MRIKNAGGEPAKNRLQAGLAALLICVAFFATLAFGQAAKPITKAGLEKALQIGGLSQKELVQQIHTRGVSFSLTPEVEADLKSKGASPEIIEAVRAVAPAPMRAPEPAPVHITPAPAPAPVLVELPKKAAPHVSLPAKPGVYIQHQGQWTELVSELVAWKKSGAIKKFTVNLGKGELDGRIAGTRSPNSMHSPVVFLISPTEGSNAADYLLIQLHEKKEGREVKVNAQGGEAKNLVPFTGKLVGAKHYQVEFTQGSGDYGFLPPATNVAEGAVPVSPKMYTFHIE